MWTFPAVPARKVGHPAPFPEELPLRLIQLYTFAGEVVLDPCMGSGQTAIAALKAGRHYVGYEVNEEYFGLAGRNQGLAFWQAGGLSLVANGVSCCLGLGIGLGVQFLL